MSSALALIVTGFLVLNWTIWEQWDKYDIIFISLRRIKTRWGELSPFTTGADNLLKAHYQGQWDLYLIVKSNGEINRYMELHLLQWTSPFVHCWQFLRSRALFRGATRWQIKFSLFARLWNKSAKSCIHYMYCQVLRLKSLIAFFLSVWKPTHHTN